MFADAKEALDFAKNIHKRIGKIGRGSAALTETTATGDDTASMRSFNSTGTRRSSFMKSIFGSSSSNNSNGNSSSNGNGKSSMLAKDTRSPRSRTLTEDDIGDPIGFQHLSHIGFNPDTGTFELNNIPPQWRKILQDSGATEADLQNKETAMFIAGFLDNVSKGKAAPPAPPASTAATSRMGSGAKKMPPPPPPKKAPPPPPKTRSPAQKAGYTARPMAPQMAARAPPEEAAPSQPKKAANVPKPPPFEDYLAFIEERKAAASARQQSREEEEAASPRPPRPSAPTGPSLNDQLLAGIRQSGKASLRHVEQPDPASLPPMSPGLSGAPADAISGLLAKALQSRKQAVAMSDSEDDEEWA